MKTGFFVLKKAPIIIKISPITNNNRPMIINAAPLFIFQGVYRFITV